MRRRQLLFITATIPVAGLLAGCDPQTGAPPVTVPQPSGGNSPVTPDYDIDLDDIVEIKPGVGLGDLQQVGAAKLKVGVQPVENGKALYLTLAPPTASMFDTAKLVLRLAIQNLEPQQITVTGITFSFPDSGVAPVTMQGVEKVLKDGPTIAPNIAEYWSNGTVVYDQGTETKDDDVSKYNQLYMNFPMPPKVRVEISVEGFPNPYRVTLPLANYGGGYPPPLRAQDMRPGECLLTGPHWANGGGAGSQIFSHDVGVVGWDGAWRETLPGKDRSARENFRAWGLPVHAMADGEVIDVSDGLPDGTQIDAFPANLPNGKGAGNFVWLRHGDERILYAHLQNGSITVQKGQQVKKGKVIGKLGHSGRSSKPHIHVEVRRFIPDDHPLRPWALTEAWMLDQAVGTPWNPDSPKWVEAKNRGVPNGSTLIWPAATRPAWYPPGWSELAFIGLKLNDYQTTFDRATSAWYRPIWFDAYEVSGTTYANVIFRPDDGTAWIARHVMSAADYQDEFNLRRDEGYRLINVTSYMSGSSVRYAAIWRKQTGGSWTAYHGASSAAHQAEFDRVTKLGYHPVNISIVSPGSVPQFTAFYVKEDVGSFAATSFLTPDQYQDQFEASTAAGQHLSYLSACQHGSSVRFSAIFQQKAPGAASTYGRHGLSASQFQAEFDTKLGEGYLTRVIAGYSSGGSATFAAAWRKPGVNL